MKRFLPAFLLLFVLLFIGFSFSVPRSYAQAVATITPPAPTDAVDPSLTANTWKEDDEVTFVGKVAARADAFLNWALQYYKWAYVPSGAQDTLQSFWVTIRNIVYLFLLLVILITAFVLMVTRGRSITIMRFIPRFIAVILLIFFSYAIVQFLYGMGDLVQDWFLRNSDHKIIQSSDLLYLGFKYDEFTGFRKIGLDNDESAFVSLLLVKLTAATYYVMTGILILRKIILWFFIILSPVFPILLLYAPLRNTGKIWVGEFFRWLLYAPLFSIFLSGLVAMWSSGSQTISGIPLEFKNLGQAGVEANILYPTAINIVLGGPGQIVNQYNSVNLPDTFALYVVALLMLWVVILLPFLLLQIFLDYFHSVSFSDNTYLKQLIANGSSFINKNPAPAPQGPPPVSPQSTGMAKVLPFANKISIPNVRPQAETFRPAGEARSLPFARPQQRQLPKEEVRQISQLTSLPVPTMQDIARYETAALSSNITRHEEVSRVHETLEKIANPSVITNNTEKERFNLVREKLVQQSQQGNPLAASILSAVTNVVTTNKSSVQTVPLTATQVTQNVQKGLEKIANPVATTNPVERKQFTQLKEHLIQESEKGNQLATSVLATTTTITNESHKTDTTEVVRVRQQLETAKQKGDPLATSILETFNTQQKPAQQAGARGGPSVVLPSVNRVQHVSLDDYEAVRKMWKENYQNMDVPPADGNDRKTWLQGDITKMNRIINLLVSSNPQSAEEAMREVSNILPFLLIGGFSQEEIIAYLKAKEEAAKEVLSDLDKKEEEEDTMVAADTKTKEAEKSMQAQESLPENPVFKEEKKEDIPKTEETSH